jgi:hypothetical protein
MGAVVLMLECSSERRAWMSTYELPTAQGGGAQEGNEPEPGTAPEEDLPDTMPPEPGTLPEEPDVTVPEPEPPQDPERL